MSDQLNQAVISGVTRRACLLSGVAFLTASSVSAAAQSGPSLQAVAEFLATRDFGVVQPSPDASLIVVEIQRPRSEPAWREADIGGILRTDLWLVNISGGAPQQLTFGERTGGAFWAPIWSPDGRTIAALTNIGMNAWRPAYIDVATGATSIAGECSVALEANFGSVSPWKPYGRKWGVWSSNSEFLTVLYPPGERNWEEGEARPAGAYDELWQRTEAGEVSDTVWDSRNLLVCDTSARLVAIRGVQVEDLYQPAQGAIKAVTLSNGGRYAAMIMAREPRPLDPATPRKPELGHNAYSMDLVVETVLEVLDVDARKSLGPVPGVENLTFVDVRRHPKWASDDSFLTVPTGTFEGNDVAWHVTIPEMAALARSARSPLDAELVCAIDAQAPSQEAFDKALSARPDLTSDKASDTVVATIPGLVADLGDGLVVCFSDGNLTGIDCREGRHWTRALPDAELVLATSPTPGGQQLILRRGQDVFRLRSGKPWPDIHPVPAPSPRANVAAIFGVAGLVWTDRDSGPTRLWISMGDDARTVMTLNAFLSTAFRPRARPYWYDQPTGERALASLLLPADYDASRPYPVVICGYPTAVVTPENLDDWASAALNEQYRRNLLCENGFVVAVPSMPVPKGSAPFEPLAWVSAQVEALANDLVRVGVAAKGRVGFYGHSYGGFAALSVAARTKGISAVVASSPFADLIAYHDLPFQWYERDSCAPSRQHFHALEVEAPNALLLRMGGAPEQKLQKYIENSPRFQIGSQSPPVLILEGQFDATSFRQVDALFSALSRQGVRVRLARYWGEGHNLGGPGNIRDAATEIITWFNQYLKRDLI